MRSTNDQNTTETSTPNLVELLAQRERWLQQATAVLPQLKDQYVDKEKELHELGQQISLLDPEWSPEGKRGDLLVFDILKENKGKEMTPEEIAEQSENRLDAKKVRELIANHLKGKAKNKRVKDAGDGHYTYAGAE